jgi:hypothetical protein
MRVSALVRVCAHLFLDAKDSLRARTQRILTLVMSTMNQYRPPFLPGQRPFYQTLAEAHPRRITLCIALYPNNLEIAYQFNKETRLCG